MCCKQANPANAIAITHHAVSCQLRHTHVNKYKRSQLRAFTILAHTPWCVMRAQLLASCGRCFKSSSANIAPFLSRFFVLGWVVVANTCHSVTAFSDFFITVFRCVTPNLEPDHCDHTPAATVSWESSMHHHHLWLGLRRLGVRCWEQQPTRLMRLMECCAVCARSADCRDAPRVRALRWGSGRAVEEESGRSMHRLTKLRI